MIKLTRLNGHPMVLNADWIKCIEATPDTMITLINNEHLMVQEPVDEVIARTIAYRRQAGFAQLPISSDKQNPLRLPSGRLWEDVDPPAGPLEVEEETLP